MLLIGFLRHLPRNNPGGSTNTLRFVGRCQTGGYESMLEACTSKPTSSMSAASKSTSLPSVVSNCSSCGHVSPARSCHFCSALIGLIIFVLLFSGLVMLFSSSTSSATVTVTCLNRLSSAHRPLPAEQPPLALPFFRTPDATQ